MSRLALVTIIVALVVLGTLGLIYLLTPRDHYTTTDLAVSALRAFG